MEAGLEWKVYPERLKVMMLVVLRGLRRWASLYRLD